jgi:YbbR domain-containing protein
MRDIGLKIVALMLAATLWFVVSAPRRERMRERIATAPLSLVSIPQDLVITTEIPGSVEVRLRGRASELRSVSSQSIEVPVDLSWVQGAGEFEFTLRPQAVNAPPGIEVVSLNPNRIRFRIERVRRRTVPIRPFLVGNPGTGYTIGEPTADPPFALVSGPSSQVLKLSEVTTDRIIMTNRTSTFVQNVAVVAESSLVRVVSPAMTQVTVPVLPEVGPEPSTPDGTNPASAPGSR